MLSICLRNGEEFVTFMRHGVHLQCCNSEEAKIIQRDTADHAEKVLELVPAPGVCGTFFFDRLRRSVPLQDSLKRKVTDCR